jgi:hypothetical protein
VNRDSVSRPQVATFDHLLLGDVVDDMHAFAGDVVVAEIMIKRQLDDVAAIDQRDRGGRGRHVHPTRRRGAIVEQVIEPDPELAGGDFRVYRPFAHRRDPAAWAAGSQPQARALIRWECQGSGRVRDSPKMTGDNSNEPWRVLGVEPPPYAGEPTPKNARLILEGRRRYLAMPEPEREAWARRAAAVDQRVKHGEIRSFHELIEAYGPLVTARATETADGIVIDLFDVPADLFP